MVNRHSGGRERRRVFPLLLVHWRTPARPIALTTSISTWAGGMFCFSPQQLGLPASGGVPKTSSTAAEASGTIVRSGLGPPVGPRSCVGLAGATPRADPPRCQGRFLREFAQLAQQQVAEAHLLFGCPILSARTGSSGTFRIRTILGVLKDGTRVQHILDPIACPHVWERPRVSNWGPTDVDRVTSGPREASGFLINSLKRSSFIRLV